jgi:hypothetical protein
MAAIDELAGITLMDESKDITPKSLEELEMWACAWYIESISAGFVSTSYYPNTTTVDRLRGYFNAGLSPAEAAHACFRGVH